ncbi:MAG: galactose-1-phosphate uridylyltransferase [Candidatus Baltobacteraceae bacterium]
MSSRRFNPLTHEWVLVSDTRLSRPWQGESAPAQQAHRPAYDPLCYLCPGNVRANGEHNPAYTQTFGFDNDYPALAPEAAAQESDAGGLFLAQRERGACRVLCFSPRHDLDVPTMASHDVRAVLDAWAGEYEELMGRPYVSAVTVFENRGAMMGASNPHPHSQLWANEHVPSELLKERDGANAYAQTHGGACLLCDYGARELERAQRIVFADDHAIVLVPFWAVWPFETLLLARTHRTTLRSCTGAERDALAAAMQFVTRRYDALFGVPFPYSMGWHQDGHLHAHYYPPLLRSASVRKYLVGYEMLAQPQRDLTPEEAAARLRAL